MVISLGKHTSTTSFSFAPPRRNARNRTGTLHLRYRLTIRPAEISETPSRCSWTALKVVGAIGFEPTTSWSQTRRSTRLSYTPMTGHIARGARTAVNVRVLKRSASCPFESDDYFFAPGRVIVGAASEAAGSAVSTVERSPNARCVQGLAGSSFINRSEYVFTSAGLLSEAARLVR